MTIYTNSNYTKSFSLRDRKTKDPISLANSSLTIHFRKRNDNISANAALILSTAANTIVITNAANGQFDINIPNSVTANLDPSDYIFDVIQTKDSANTRLFGGSVTVRLGVTR